MLCGYLYNDLKMMYCNSQIIFELLGYRCVWFKIMNYNSQTVNDLLKCTPMWMWINKINVNTTYHNFIIWMLFYLKKKNKQKNLMVINNSINSSISRILMVAPGIKSERCQDERLVKYTVSLNHSIK